MENENTNHEHRHHHHTGMRGWSKAWRIAKWILIVLVILAFIKFLYGSMIERGMMGGYFFMKEGTGTIKKYKASPGKRILEIRKDDAATTPTTTVVETTGTTVPAN